jgi:glutathione S-transferase
MTDEPALQLYAYWRSMAAYRVRVALNLKGIRAQEIPVNLEAGEQLAPEFLAVNPEGAVPALIEPGQPPLTQSTAILE